MKGKYLILSNNPLVIDGCQNVEIIKGTLMDVLIKARDYIHDGHKLLTHPLAGSIKPNETPYKSIVISSKSEGFDTESLSIIEGSLAMTKKMLLDRPLPEWNERVNDDFQVIDKSLLDAALLSLSVY